MPELTIPEAIQLARQWLRAGRAADAEQLCRRVLSAGLHPDALQLLSSALLMQDRRREAADAIRALIRLNPNSPEAYHNLGFVLTPIDLDGAFNAYQSALALRPESIESLSNLADILRQRGDTVSAGSFLEEAIARRPDFTPAQFNLAICRFQQERHAEAEMILRALLREHPNLADAHHALGNVLRAMNRPAEAVNAYGKALALKPDLVEARWHASLALLTVGDFENGWKAHEARRKLQGIWREPTFPKPEWRGEDPSGKRILLWTEQGFGDGIHFMRYAAEVGKLGARVSMLCQPELKRLFQTSPAIERIFTTPEEAADFDLHAPLLSLPALLHTTLQTIPAETPYLFADPTASARWKERLPAGRKIGLAWASLGRERLIPASAFNALTRVPGVTFVSLQKGDGPRPHLPLLDFTSDLRDFADTAALIDQLDLVITCDTAVAHLAGAMGKSTWILLPFASPWRWLLDRSDTPWYPTVRLFRQPAAGDWISPVDAVLRHLV